MTPIPLKSLLLVAAALGAAPAFATLQATCALVTNTPEQLVTYGGETDSTAGSMSSPLPWMLPVCPTRQSGAPTSCSMTNTCCRAGAWRRWR